MSDLETLVSECKDERLDLSWKCRSLDEVKAVARGIKENNTLTFLNLYGNKIGDEGAAALAEGIKVNTNLKEISLWNNKIGTEGAAALAEAIKVNQSITELDLQGNDIGAEGAAALAESIKVNTNLKELNLEANEICAEGAAALAEAIKENKSIQKLYLRNNWIGEKGAAALAEGIKVYQSITKLGLWKNNIGDVGAAAIAESIKANHAIKSLNLRCNGIGAEGAAVLAEGIKENNTLTYLNLYGNKIGDEGAAALAEGIKENKSIQKLDLGANNIGDVGAAAIAESIKENKSIETLGLGANNIGDEGAAAIAEGIKVNQSITELYLGGNGIGDEGAAAIAEGIKVNQSIQELSLWNNDIGAEGAAALAEGIKTHRTLSTLIGVTLSDHFKECGSENEEILAKLKEYRSDLGYGRCWCCANSFGLFTRAKTCKTCSNNVCGDCSVKKASARICKHCRILSSRQAVSLERKQRAAISSASQQPSLPQPSTPSETLSKNIDQKLSVAEEAADVGDDIAGALQTACTTMPDWNGLDEFGEFLGDVGNLVGNMSGTAKVVLGVIRKIFDMIATYLNREQWLDAFNYELSIIKRDLEEGKHVFDNHEFITKIDVIVRESESTVRDITSRGKWGAFFKASSDHGKIIKCTKQLNDLRQHALFSMMIEVKKDTTKTRKFHQFLANVLEKNHQGILANRDAHWQMFMELESANSQRHSEIMSALEALQRRDHPQLHAKLTLLEQEFQHLKQDHTNLQSLIGFDDRSNWESKEAKGLDDDKLFPLDTKSPEYHQVESMFKQTLARMDIESIERIEDGYAHEAFSVEVKRQQEKITRLANFTWNESTMRRHLFHGASAEAVSSILNDSGFVPLMNQRSLHGCGSYFTSKASVADTYSQEDAEGLKYIMLCSVTVGLCVKGSENQRQLPHLPGEKRRRYNSFVNNEDDPTVFVVQRGCQAYPKYLIKYY